MKQLARSAAASGVPALLRVFSRAGHQPLSYADFGQLSSRNVVFYQHGWPGSRIGGAMLHEAARKLNVRVIAVDRPGFGASTFNPNHTLASWATSLQHLADQMGIQQYSILGVSGGAPFAAACAHDTPADRIAGLGLLCPLGPTAKSSQPNPTACVDGMSSLLMVTARHWPKLARGIWKASRQWMTYDHECMSRFALLAQDKVAMQAAPHIAQAIRSAVLEGLRTGAHGVVHEMRLVQQCWGFSLQDVKVPHSFMWHGLQDPIVPYAMAKTYESIPGCRPAYFASETHTTLVINRLSTALETLVHRAAQAQTVLMPEIRKPAVVPRQPAVASVPVVGHEAPPLGYAWCSSSSSGSSDTNKDTSTSCSRTGSQAVAAWV